MSEEESKQEQQELWWKTIVQDHVKGIQKPEDLTDVTQEQYELKLIDMIGQSAQEDPNLWQDEEALKKVFPLLLERAIGSYKRGADDPASDQGQDLASPTTSHIASPRELSVKFVNSQSQDSVTRALALTREVPLDSYMNFDKAAEVRRAQHQREKTRKHATKSADPSESRFADSSFIKTEYMATNINEAQKRKERNNQYRSIAHFKAHEDYLLRQYENMPAVKKLTVQRRIEVKHKKIERRRKKIKDDSTYLSGPPDINDNLSNFSQVYPDCEPAIARKIENANRAARPGRRSIEPQNLERNNRAQATFHSIQRSMIPLLDNKSVAMSGMMVTKNKKLQTLNQTDLVPELIYADLEIKVRELIYGLMAPTINRQKAMEKKQTSLFHQQHQFDTKLRDCQLWIKKQTNVKEELDGIIARIEAADLTARKIGAGLNNVEAKLEIKCESIAAQVRVLKNEVKSSSRFIEKNNQDKTKLQEIVNQFKDRLMEKYKVLADEYTQQFRFIEHRYMGLQENISKVEASFDLVTRVQQDIKVDHVKDVKNLDDAVEQIEALKSCYKFDERIDTLENQAKSDLMAVTIKMQEVFELDKYNMKRSEAMKLMYSMQMDVAHKVMGVDKQRKRLSGKSSLAENFDPYTQASLNLLEWQITFNKREPFDRDQAIKLSEEYAEVAETNTRKLRTDHLIVELNARSRKDRKKPQRSNSFPIRLLKINAEIVPKVEMPVVKKKVVVFARENTILGVKPGAMPEASTPKSPDAEEIQNEVEAPIEVALPKQPKKSNLRKFNKLLEPFKKREINLLSHLKRSNSFVWAPVEMTNINTLYTDPNAPKMLDRLKLNTIKSGSSIESSGGHTKSALERLPLMKPSRKHLKFMDSFGSKVGDALPDHPNLLKKGSKMSSESVNKRLKEPSSQQLQVSKQKMSTIPLEQPSSPQQSQDGRSERIKLSKKPSSLRQSRLALESFGAENEEPALDHLTVSSRSSKNTGKKGKVKRKVSKRISRHERNEHDDESGIQAASTESRKSRHLQTVDEEQKTPVQRKSTMKLQQPHVSDADSSDSSRSGSKSKSQGSAEQKSSRPDSVASKASSSKQSKQKVENKKQPKKKKTEAKSSESDAMFSSSESNIDIHPAYYQEFISQEDFHEEIDEMREELRVQILEEARQSILGEAVEIIEEKVGEAQYSMTSLLEEQLALSQEQMKEIMTKEVSTVKTMAENIKTTLLPENITKVENMLAKAKGEQKAALDECTQYVAQSIKTFATRLDYFKIEIDVIMTKFKRIVSDQEVFKKVVSTTLSRTREMVRVMRSEQLAVTKITSTLVELEFIQQSLDFQDEFDKTQMNLYGLNDLNMSLTDFIAKSGEIAQRKVHHDALKHASEVELEQLGEQNMKKGYFEMTDSGTYQAIEMSENWPEHLTDDNLRSQVYQAFKMACVYYKPSPVLYRGQKYNRRSLIEAKRCMLDAEWQLMLKFQPYKRLWGEDSGVDFFEQFTSKLDSLIQQKKNGHNVASIMEVAAHDTFVKIMSGTQIYDMKLRDAEDHDELMSSGDFEIPDDIRLASALQAERQSPKHQQLAISTINVGADTSQSSTTKLLPGEEHQRREQLRLQGQRNFEVITNRNKLLSPEDSVSNTIDSRTRSMLKALQGKSMFGPSLNESTFSTEDVDKTIQSKSKPRLNQGESQKRLKTRSVQQKIDAAASTTGLLNDLMMHTPAWLNQSPAIQEQMSGQNHLGNTTTKAHSKGRNSKALRHHFTMHNQSQPEVGNSHDFSRENPLVEMRPLVGNKEQLSRLHVQSMRGLDLPHLDHGMTAAKDGGRESKNALNIGIPGRATQFSVSPWTSKNQAFKNQNLDKPGQNVSLMQQQLDIAVVGKQDFSTAQLLDRKIYHSRPKKGSAGLGVNGSKHTGSQIMQSPINHPLSIPASLSMSGLNSPFASGGSGMNHALSHAALILPKVETPNNCLMPAGQNSYSSLGVGGSDLKIVSSKGMLGAKKQTFQIGMNVSNVRATGYNGVKQQHNTSGRSNTTSGGCWGGPDDELGLSVGPGKMMQAKLGGSNALDAAGDDKLDTQKLKEIARQKKQKHHEMSSAFNTNNDGGQQPRKGL